MIATLAATFLCLSLAACQEGPAEKQGRKVDNTVEKVQDKLQDKGPAQKAGERLDDMTDNS